MSCWLIESRSAEQVTARLDRLVGKIHDIQRDYMHGEKPRDVVVVSLAIIQSLAVYLTSYVRLRMDISSELLRSAF